MMTKLTYAFFVSSAFALTPAVALAEPAVDEGGAAFDNADPVPREALPAVNTSVSVPPLTGAPRYDHFRVGLGFRLASIGNPRFDLFANDDALVQSSLDASYAIYTHGSFAIAPGLSWDYGARSSGARGLSTRLSVNRLSLPVEARWYFVPWLAGFAKVAPGAIAYGAHVEDASAPAPLEHTAWAFSGDASLGASVCLAGRNTRAVRLWLTSEIGYGISTTAALQAAPNRDAGEAIGSDEPTRLGSFAANGAFWRTGLALTF
jgi:hypothetical protein